MESVNADVPVVDKGESSEPLKWIEVTPVSGRRTEELLKSDPRLGKLEPIGLLENIKPNSDLGIVLFPGAFDNSSENEALNWGQDTNSSVFHIKYPADSSFSVRREVAQLLDHTEEMGVKKYQILAGSWGGIPAFNSIYNLLREGGAEIKSFVAVAAALQSSDFTLAVRDVGGYAARAVLAATRWVKIPRRQDLARLSGFPDFQYSDSEVLKKIEEIPTLLLIPPGGRDWLIDAKKSYDKYFPTAIKVEYPGYNNLREKIKTAGGHYSEWLINDIRHLIGDFFTEPGTEPNLPKGFRRVK